MHLSDVVSHSGLSIYAIVAMVLFLAAFVAIVIRVFSAKSREMQQNARLPLDDGAAPPVESPTEPRQESDHD